MSNTLLLSIDFINDIVHPEGKIASVAAEVSQHAVLDCANQALALARQNQILCAHVVVGFSSHYIECPQASPVFGRAPQLGALQLGQWGTQIHDALQVLADEPLIIKHRVSAFYNTDLETILRANRVDTLVLMGVSTQMAIETTAREAHDRDYQVVILSDACAAANQQVHQASLFSLSRLARVCRVDQWL